jgi:repressor LexA
MKGLTKRQQEILGFIQEFIRTHRYSPSYREIMRQFGFTSLGSVYKHLQVLKRKGLVTAEKKCSRSIKPLEEEAPPLTRIELELPFIGHISAGFPIETFPKSQTLAIPEFLVHDPNSSYIIRAKGNSLNDEMISDGDLIIIEAGREAHPGEWIIALLNDHETLVKRYYPEGQYVRLASSDSSHPPLMVRIQDLVVQGVVVGLLRLFD